jgi:N-6 DNA Methylase
LRPLETYLRELRDIRSSGAGVDEESQYTPLANLLNEAGRGLKPRVRCIMQLGNRGAGKPDGGLFTPDQFPKRSLHDPLQGQKPSRGAIEVKPVKDDAFYTAEGQQVSRYWKEYRQVLVTNCRDFVLVAQDRYGNLTRLECFRLAADAKSFWKAAEAPRALDQKLGDRFIEFLERVMLHAAPLVAPEDVAWFLASYAREAKARIEGVGLPALSTVREALEEALGLKFEGEKGEHFFRSSLVQTLFYGVFSAWVLWAKKTAKRTALSSTERFNWRLTSSFLRVPMISRLFYLIADPSQLENMNLIEVLDWTGQVLNRIERGSFFARFEEGHAVQYFYEPFLENFDPELRKQLGVWYTPPEIVEYMVERVDTVLRQELGLPLGLADKNVYVLDPCCGTGSYLVETLNRIHRTLKEGGEDALTASDLKEAAQKRVFGFEILPAPFVVSHLQLGLLLQNLDAPLSEASKERAAVYLTNALAGWEPPKGPKKQLAFWELAEERDAADHIKREEKILVILGNPPYNAFAGVSPAEEQGLVEAYKQGLISEWGIKKFNLDDLYVRFFRLAERRIVQGPPGRGIVCFVSNFSYLSDPSFVVMRQRFLAEFDKL